MRSAGPLGTVPRDLGGRSLFGFAMGWVGAVIGLHARSTQAADVLSMVPAFLLGFVSNVFVNTANLPAWLAGVRELEPMSAVVAASRTLFGTSEGIPEPAVWSLQHPVVTTIGMSVVLLGVMGPLAVHRYIRVAG